MMKSIYDADMQAFIKDNGLEQIEVRRDGEQQTPPPQIKITGIRKYKGTWVWKLLKPARVVYKAGKTYKSNRSVKEALMGKKKFVKDYIKAQFPDDAERKRQENATFDRNIKFSVLVPLFNTPKKFLKDMIESVQAQTYKNWELILVDASDDEHSFVGDLCKKYYENDSRIVYKKLDKNYGISGNTNEAIKLATGDYIALFDHDDILVPTVLYEDMVRICETGADFVYTDEATFLEDDIYDIVTFHFKPDYAIDNLRANNYICHFSVFNRELIDKVGMFRQEYDGSQDHDMILRLTEAANRVEHIAKILYLWRSHGNSVSQDINAKTYAIDAAKRAVTDSLKRDGFKAEVESSPAFPTIFKINYELTEHAKISIIIPNKDNIALLFKCIDSILKKSTYDNYEIIIMENNSTEDKTFEFYDLISRMDKVRVIRYEKPFNYSDINNQAVAQADGKYVLFLNNDIEITTPAWMEELLMYAQRKDVGAVGAKLFYENNTVQHNGVIIGAGPDGIAIHSHAGEPRGSVGYMGRMYYAQDVSAVTAACMLIAKEKFLEVGGFDTGLAVAYNDVDLCMKLRQKGYLNVINPFAEAFHYESITRGYETKRGNQDRFQREVKYMKDKWSDVLSKGDPFYNPNVSKSVPWGFGPGM